MACLFACAVVGCAHVCTCARGTVLNGREMGWVAGGVVLMLRRRRFLFFFDFYLRGYGLFVRSSGTSRVWSGGFSYGSTVREGLLFITSVWIVLDKLEGVIYS